MSLKQNQRQATFSRTTVITMKHTTRSAGSMMQIHTSMPLSEACLNVFVHTDLQCNDENGNRYFKTDDNKHFLIS